MAQKEPVKKNGWEKKEPKWTGKRMIRWLIKQNVRVKLMKETGKIVEEKLETNLIEF